MRIINKFQWGGGLQALIEQSRKPKSVYSYAFNQAETLPLYRRDVTLPEVTVSAKRVVKRQPTTLPEVTVTGYSKSTKEKLKRQITNDYLKSIGAFPTKESFAVNPEYESDNQIDVDELEGVPYNEQQALPTMQDVMDYLHARKRQEAKRQFTGETPTAFSDETTYERPNLNIEDLKSGIDQQYVPKPKNQKLVVRNSQPLSFQRDNLNIQQSVQGNRPTIYAIQQRQQIPNEYLESALTPLGYARQRREAQSFAFDPRQYTDYYPIPEVVVTAKRKKK